METYAAVWTRFFTLPAKCTVLNVDYDRPQVLVLRKCIEWTSRKARGLITLDTDSWLEVGVLLVSFYADSCHV